MEFLPEYGLALPSGTVALFRRADGSLVAFFASNSVSGQNIGGYYHAETPNDGITITSTLGIVLNTDGTLSQDSLATSTMAY